MIISAIKLAIIPKYIILNLPLNNSPNRNEIVSFEKTPLLKTLALFVYSGNNSPPLPIIHIISESNFENPINPTSIIAAAKRIKFQGYIYISNKGIIKSLF